MKSSYFESAPPCEHSTVTQPGDRHVRRATSAWDRAVVPMLWHAMRRQRRTGQLPDWLPAALWRADGMTGQDDLPLDDSRATSTAAAPLRWFEQLAKLCQPPAAPDQKTPAAAGPTGSWRLRWSRVPLTPPGEQILPNQASTDTALVLAFGENPAERNGRLLALQTQSVKWYANDPIRSDLHLGRLNGVFLQAVDSLWPQVEEVLETCSQPVAFTGHGAAGAVAAITAARAKLYFPDLTFQIVTFGSPPVGDQEFAKAYDASLPDHARVEVEDDIVPHFPLSSLMSKLIVPDGNAGSSSVAPYAHLGRLYYFDRDGLVTGDAARQLDRGRRLRLFSLLVSQDREKAASDHSLLTGYLPRLDRK